MITTAERAEQEHAVVSAIARTFVAMMQHDSRARALLVDVVPDAFPWVRFLPLEDRRAFVTELVEVLRAAESLDHPNLAPIARVIAGWQHSAEVHADPELTALVRQDADAEPNH